MYRNQDCLGAQGENGTCITQNDCDNRQGVNVGFCADGYGVCCRVSFTCKMTNEKNETEFVNPSYPSGDTGTSTCDVTIEKNSDICQIRLDFIEFSLAQPDYKGVCSHDAFMVRSTVGEKLPILCGENSGQHMYVDVGRQSGNPVVLSVVSTGSLTHARKWRIKVSMIPCGSLDIVPAGCVQYFRSPSSLVRSFNYGPETDKVIRYPANTRYAVCLRVEENFCSIKWETETAIMRYPSGFEGNRTSFSFGRPYESGASGANCEGDFVTIEQGSTYGMGPGEDRFCGTKLHEKNVLISHSKPFIMRVTSSSDPSLGRNPAAFAQSGFSLRYTQLPCVD
ncbi:uncharacterized protein LOC111254024 isoform X2 [Varroa destructor]|uniref:CUB domain-containing protein n=1 Tax=Varroa destructor TaxID=109461 RepID=A0A7M7MJ86_VARDE|nr:uncharacterized protein LOC111254024 isoform X2 [Varroa destructor]XP_022670186.1 uncharacterized protein LOC111254024 isoform X2 [Varroa destructor]